MSAVDMALRQAQQQGANAWRILETAMSGEVVTASEWQGLLEQALDEGLFRLQQQPVFACRSRGLMHRELFLRLPDPRQAGEVIPAGVFMPMAESRRMSTRIDRWVIQAVVERVAARLGMDRIAINLPPRVTGRGGLPGLACRVSAGASRVCPPAHPGVAGVRCQRPSCRVETVDRTSRSARRRVLPGSFSSFAAIRELKAYYLKVDGSYTRDLEVEGGNAFFLQAVTDIAQGLELTVIAESVESAASWERLESIGVDGGRGYWLAGLSDISD